jgi:hypothetical protein
VNRRDLDKVAYLRFASVGRRFEDLDDFKTLGPTKFGGDPTVQMQDATVAF